MESKSYDLKDLRKCYSKYGRKLNDYMFASISASFSKYFTELGIKNQTHFTVSVPVNMKPMPTKISEVRFNNEYAPCLTNVPISTDLDFTMSEIRKYFDIGYSIKVARFGMWILTAVGSLPTALSRHCIMDGCHNLDMIISNTPGPKQTIYF